MNYIKYFENFTFNDLYDKNEWVDLSKEDRIKLKKEIWEIVDIAYKPIGGHVRIVNPESIVNDPDLRFWTATNVDNEPYTDVVIFSRPLNGYKISGWGHDGSKISRKELIKKLISLLKTKDFWIEVSGRPAEVLINSGCVYCELDIVEKIFPKSIINWIGNGIYTRTLENGEITEEEYLIGNPKI